MPTILEEFEDSAPLLRAPVEASSETTPSMRLVSPELEAIAEASATISPTILARVLHANAKSRAAAYLTLGVIYSDVELSSLAQAYASGFFRLNDEPNMFFEETVVAVQAQAILQAELGAIVTLESKVKASCSIGFELSVAAYYEIIIEVELIPEEDTSRGDVQEYVGQFSIDGEVIPFKRAKVDKASNGIEKTLDITLARPEDRFKVTSTAEYKFELNTINENGDDDWETLIDSTLASRQFSVAWNEGPDDSLSLSSRANIGNKFRKVPIAGLTYYDSAKMTLTVDDFKKIKDTSGNQYLVELHPFAYLALYDIFQIIVDRCDLSEYYTNISNFNIKRFDATKRENMLQSLAGLIGAFEPLIWVDEVEETLKIIDTTQTLPAGFPSPRALYCRNYKLYSENSQVDHIDGRFVSWVPNDTEVDTFFLYRLEQDDDDLEDGTSTYLEETWKDYRTFENPDVVINSVLYSELKRTYINGNQVDEKYTIWEFDALDRPTGYYADLQKRTPEIVGEFLTGGGAIIQKVNEVYYDIFYGPHKYFPEKTIQTKSIKRTYGYAARDSINQQMGEDYLRDFVDVYEVGNLTVDMSLEYRLITTEVEEAIPLPNGQIRIKSYTVDHLANIVRPGDISEPRSGDISVNTLGRESAEILIFADEDNPVTDGIYDEASLGEVPPEIGIPLERRKLKQKNEGIVRADLSLIGRRRDIDIGSQITAKYRDETNLGSYLIEGMYILIEQAGTDQQLVTTELNGRKIK